MVEPRVTKRRAPEPVAGPVGAAKVVALQARWVPDITKERAPGAGAPRGAGPGMGIQDPKKAGAVDA